MKILRDGLLKNIEIFGKYLDQPALVEKVYKKMPPVLIAGATGFGLYDTFNNKKVREGEESKTSRFVKNACILTGTVFSTLVFGKRFIELPHIHHKKHISHIIEKVRDEKQLVSMLEDIKAGKIVDKGGEILSLKKVKVLYEGLKKKGDDLINEVIPSGHSHGHAHSHGEKQGFFSRIVEKFPEMEEIKKLSILGAIPVIGGIAGGVAGDTLTGEDVGKTFPDKVKEGAYQYLANIVLCNVGAGVALFAIHNTKYKNSRPVKFFGMLAGILAVGVAGGSFIANYIGKKVINPLLGEKSNKKEEQGNFYKEIYNERTPEAIDIGLHIDDVASAGFLSGLNIIAPALPVLYSISAYRAGIGYRNNAPPAEKSLSSEAFTGAKNDIFYGFKQRKHHYHHKHRQLS